MLTILGLIIICVAWLYEFSLLTNKKDTRINSSFVGIYTAGVFLLVLDGFISGLGSIAWLNLISFIFSAGVLFVLRRKK
ncbi:MAG: hypothetical protein Athens071416_443 [Parcubacteria group bacterium Athens0714_16]|nr:MAG: hypothetical protein Athens071416_443 [Parcubacteria group bacterium Athens0714_16]